MKRTCERVQARIPHLVEGELPHWRQRLLRRHIARCDECGDELERQHAVAQGLHGLGRTEERTEIDPPGGLLETILADVHEPGLRARVAAPARGAVSGARPELSLAALVLLAGLAYLTWRAVRRIVEVVDRDR